MLLLQVINGQLYTYTAAWIIFVTYAPGVCMNTYIATMSHNHALANGQSKAAARCSFDLVDPVERIEYFAGISTADSNAVVLKENR